MSARTRLLPALLAAAVLGGCAGADDAGPGASTSAGGSARDTPATAATSLAVEIWPAGPDRPSITRRLRCDPASGTVPDPAAACAALARGGPALLAPVPADRACAEIWGGPQTARVEGTVAGEPVASTFSRANACEMERWDRLVVGALGERDLPAGAPAP
jgi:hypothetical protein